MLKGERGAESNRKLPHLLIEDMPLGRTAASVPDFAVKDLPLGAEHSDDN